MDSQKEISNSWEMQYCLHFYQLKPCGNKKILEIFSEPENDKKAYSSNEKTQ